MGRVEILVEELSMEVCLRNLLPMIVPSHWVLDVNYFIRPHQGKSDLRKSIPAKMQVFSNWHEPISVIILHDQDSADCKILKQQIKLLCGSFSKGLLIRIICRELESWYLGDLLAIEKAFPSFKSTSYISRAKFRNPDRLNAKDQLKDIFPDYREVSSSREISKFLDVNNNRSESFNQFIKGIRKIFV